MTVEYNRQPKEFPIEVMKNEGPLQLAENGWNLIWISPYFSCKVSDTHLALEGILSKHASVFSEGLGRMKNIQARLLPKPSTQSRFWKARTVVMAQ